MLTKLTNSALYRSFRRLPLWAQIAIPVVGVLVVIQLIAIFKVFFGIALVLGIIYAIMRATDAFGK